MDTAKDARILVAEDALRRLNEIVNNRKLKLHIEYNKIGTILHQAGSYFYEVKYSYVPAEQVAKLEPTQKIVDDIIEFKKMVESALKSIGFKPSTIKEILVFAELNYSFRTIEGLKRRLTEFDEEPAYAIDILAVEVSEVKPVEDSKNLTECRCTDGKRIWKILTNIEGVQSGEIYPCAVLPPVEMVGIVSEAMFLGGEPLPETTNVGPLTQPSASVLDQARAQVLHIIKRMQ
ncbi:MAG: hypothetical protein JW779_04460 [Candidatus Thorarchaeota archaeon]|nr:hypothetical protein [Candidatus Thorarchaeota archaeon]